MVNHGSSQFKNNRSVRFDLASFALPVATVKKKHLIYSAYLSKAKGTKNNLLRADDEPDKHGFDMVAQWSYWIFAANQRGIYVAFADVLRFTVADDALSPQKLCVANDRLFAIALNRKRLNYSVDLRTDWEANTLMSGVIVLPESYGLCRDIMYYRNNLLVVCDNGLLTVNRNLTLSHLSDDSDILLANLRAKNNPYWESDWFGLGYATDTQVLREIFLQVDVPITMVVESNRTRRTIKVRDSARLQKLKINLRGDQFKIALFLDTDDFCVSNLAAVVQYGKRG